MQNIETNENKEEENDNELKQKIKDIQSRKEGYNIIEHLVSVDHISTEYQVDLNKQDYSRSKGLTDQQIKEKRMKYGMNELTPPKQKPEWLKILLLFTSLFNVLLLICCLSAYGSYLLDSSTYDNIYVGTVLLIIVI